MTTTIQPKHEIDLCDEVVGLFRAEKVAHVVAYETGFQVEHRYTYHRDTDYSYRIVLVANRKPTAAILSEAKAVARGALAMLRTF